jgi:NinB protein
MTQTLVIDSHYRRQQAHKLVEAAPIGAVLTIKPASRSTDQNAKLWALLSDISRAMPSGRRHTPEVWKELFCHACGHATQFEMGLNGQPFPVGFRTSRMSRAEMADLIEFINAWAAEQGITLREVAA